MKSGLMTVSVQALNQGRDKGKPMNKAQKRQVEMIHLYLANGMSDTAARSLSALIRSAVTAKGRAELLALAETIGVVNHPDFII